MLKTIWRGAVIAGLAIGLSACIPEFANPLVGGNKADPDIIGTWNAKGGSDPESVPIDIKAEGDGLTVVMREPSGGGATNELRFAATTAEIDGARYINMKPLGDDVPPDTGSLVMRYELKDGAIHVVSLDNAKIKAAIDAGKLKGASGAGSDTAAKVTSSADEVAAFFATDEGKAAFVTTPAETLVLTKATP